MSLKPKFIIPDLRSVLNAHLRLVAMSAFKTHTLPRYHLENPYWQTFDKYVIPLLDGDMDLRRFNELDTSKEVRVEQDETLWKKVKAHQPLNETRAQGNY